MKREAWKEVNIMRKKHSFKLFISIVLMCLVSIMTIAVSSDKNQDDLNSKSIRDVYVFSKKASLYEKPSVKAKQIKVIQSGDVLSVYEEKGYWLYVKTKDESGWISKFLINLLSLISSAVTLEIRGVLNFLNTILFNSFSIISVAFFINKQ